MVKTTADQDALLTKLADTLNAYQKAIGEFEKDPFGERRFFKKIPPNSQVKSSPAHPEEPDQAISQNLLWQGNKKS